MSPHAYYNEIDPYAAAWLRNLIAAGHIAPGEVDERSIADVRPDDLLGFVQCHFFAGIGAWSYALRRAGWDDQRPVWTGSCPCQPFSAAGRGEGFADERHLWPAFHHLIAQRRPPVVFGEQVASKAVDAWIDLVQDDLEGLGYAFGAVPFPSAGVGAPHIRDRAYFVAHANGDGRSQGRLGQPASWHDGIVRDGPSGRLADAGGPRVRDQGRRPDAGAPGGGQGEGHQRERLRHDARHDDGSPSDVADTAGARPQGGERAGQRPDAQLAPAERAGATGGMADSNGQQHDGAGSRRPGRWVEHPDECATRIMADATLGGRGEERPHAGRGALGDRTEGLPAGSFAGGGNQRPGPTNGFWRDPDWLHCRDGRWRPVEPGTFPLVDGSAFRMDSGGPFAGKSRAGILKGAGNAINAEAAAAFISASLDVMGAAE